MNIKSRCVLATLVSGLIFSQIASAADGTISITGQITDVTCAIAVNGGGNNATVTLPTVSVSALPNSGETAGTTSFRIALSECSGDTLGNAYAYFELGSAVDSSSGRLNNVSGTASNVQVQLLDKNLTPIVAGSASQGNGAMAEISGGAATLEYAARYYATGAAGAGSVSTQVDYSIVYD